MPTEVVATMPITPETTRASLIEELMALDVPEEARLTVQHFAGRPGEASTTNLVWKWSIGPASAGTRDAFYPMPGGSGSRRDPR